MGVIRGCGLFDTVILAIVELASASDGVSSTPFSAKMYFKYSVANDTVDPAFRDSGDRPREQRAIFSPLARLVRLRKSVMAGEARDALFRKMHQHRQTRFVGTRAVYGCR